MKRLGIGIVGSGFNAKFHLQGFVAVRDADILGVWSPNAKHAEETAALARTLGVGAAKAFPSIAAMVKDPAIDAIWMCGPNFARVANFEEIVDAVKGGAKLLGIACEKPLARNVAEAKRIVDLVKKAGIPTGYLENQVFAPHVATGRTLLWARGARITGRPYLARAAEEHSGPHMPWFWQGKLQGGGVLNDMMCHSALTTSWSFVGAGLRLSAELLGPEYSMSWNTLDSGLKLFFSREVSGKAGEDLVEKQNAEMGLMPVVPSEAAAYGYEAEDRHFVRAFLDGTPGALTFDHGLEVVTILMTAYQSAEQGKTLDFPPPGIEAFVPAVAKGTWKP